MFTFTVDRVSNLVWDNPEHSSFSCVVKYIEYDEEHNSGITPNDPNTHIHEIWVKGVAGEYGSIAEYVLPVFVPPPPSQDTPEIAAAKRQFQEASLALSRLLANTNNNF